MPKYAAKGTTISVDGVTIAHVRDIGSSSGGETERVDVTTHDSPDDRRESVAGFKGEATMTFTIAFDPSNASHAGLITLHGSGETVPVIVTYPTTPTATTTFDAYVTNFPVPGAPIDGALLVEVTLAITGEINFPTPA